MLYTGSCHCGRIRFEVEGEVDSGLACNLLHVRRASGSLACGSSARGHAPAHREDAAMATYLFNNTSIRHRFCHVTAGSTPFGEAEAPGRREADGRDQPAHAGGFLHLASVARQAPRRPFVVRRPA